MRLHRDERGREHGMGNKSVLYTVERLYVKVIARSWDNLQMVRAAICRIINSVARKSVITVIS